MTQSRRSWLALAIAGLAAPAVLAQTPCEVAGGTMNTLSFTNGSVNFSVPTGVNQVEIEALGAEGGFATNNPGGCTGGQGGRAFGNLATTGGETLVVFVGGKGNAGNSPGFNGGGGACGDTTTCSGGGGGSDVRQGGSALANRKIVAAGGGGTEWTGSCSSGYHGGNGGGLTGDTGCGDSGCANPNNGSPGTQLGGGAGSPMAYGFYPAGNPGALGVGGLCTSIHCGGGGGGYYGGGGASADGSGGGGSSYIGGVTAGVTTTGGRLGNGQVKICTYPPQGQSCDLTPIESKLDDGARWVSDAENNAQTTTINNNTNTGITNVRADVTRVESKLDDGARWVSDAENNTQTTSINTNTNTGVTNIRGDITLLESKLDGIDLGVLDSALADIKSDIGLVESKLDDETRFTDDTELAAQTTTINNNTNTGIGNVRGDVTRVESKLDDGARWVSDAENNAQTTSINNNTNTGITNVRADVAFLESKLDLIDTSGLTAIESKLDDEARFTDDTEFNAGVTSINNNVDAAETSINNNVDAAETSINNNVDAAETSINNNIDTAETNIRADVALVESKLDDEARFTDDTELAVISSDIALLESKLDVKEDAITNLESKLDDETRFTDDTEYDAGVTSINNNVDAAETSINNNVDAAETSINNNVDAAETSINSNVDTAETNIRADVALVESKLDALATDELANLESKLDDEARFTDDTEFNAGVTSINNNVDAAETSINANVDAAETSINNNVDAAETSINNNVDTAETNIRADVALVESKLDALATDELANLESKLDDEARFTDDTEQGAQTTTIVTEIDENQAILEDAKSEIMLLESKLDGLQNQVSDLTCVIIDLLLTPEDERCSDTAECGFGAFPSGLENLPTPAACIAANSGHVASPPSNKSGRPATARPDSGIGAAPASAGPSIDLASFESMVAEATEAASSLRQQSRSFISSALEAEQISPLLLLSADQGGLFEQVAALVSDSLALYRSMKLEPGQLVVAEEAFAEAERLRVEGSRVAAYRAYRTAYRELLAISSQTK